MDLSGYRASVAELERTADLLRLMPRTGLRALDIGARDGHFSRLMADRFGEVVALDLEKPDIDDPRVVCLKGNAAKLPLEDRSFDFVFCAEVLEHIPAPLLPLACQEIQRITRGHILIGVPYRQDLRLGRTTCYSCGHTNPPWGHVNSFDEERLKGLFSQMEVATITQVGSTTARTTALGAALMAFAGHPYGTYDQEETCIHCDRPLLPPPSRTTTQRVATKLAIWSDQLSELTTTPRGKWIHVLFRRP